MRHHYLNPDRKLPPLQRGGIFILLMLLAIAGFGQEVRLSGYVRDAETKEPLAGATIRAMGAMTGAIADARGYYSLTLPNSEVLVEFAYLGYEKQFLKPSASKSQGASKILTVDLKPSPVEVGVVEITDKVIERVFEDNRIHLYDYEFSGDDLIVIHYDRKAKRPVLALVNERDSIIDVEWGPEPPGRLVKDCMGNIHALGKDYACQLWVHDNQINYYLDPLADFQKFVEPCLGSIGSNYYFSLYQFNNQILSYYTYNTTSEEWYFFDKVMDKDKMHALMDPLGIYAGIASTEEQFMSISPETWVEVGKIDPEFQFEQLAFFYPVDAPLRVVGKEVVVFDHRNGEIRRMDEDGSLLHDVDITYQNEPHWRREIFVDEVRAEAYTAFLKNGIKTLKEIDLDTGKLLGEYAITFPFATKPIVRNGILYFLYKDNIYDDTNRLYRWRIK